MNLQTSRGFTGQLPTSTRQPSIQARVSQGSSPSSIRANALVELDGEPHILQKVTSSGAGGPSRAKLMNIKNRNIVYKTWPKGTTLNYLATEGRPATYSYKDESDSCFVFYDDGNFEELRVGKEVLGDASKWLEQGVTKVDLTLFRGKVIQLGFRGDVIFEVVDIPTRAGSINWRKDSKNNHKNNFRSKHVLLSNGETVLGPKYLEIGDRVVVDPDTSSMKRL